MESSNATGNTRVLSAARRATSFAFALGACLLGAEARGFQNEPDGWEKAKLGASFEEIQKAYPKAIETTPKPAADAPKADAPPYMRFLALENTRAVGLSPCRTTFSFVAGKLYRVDFNCGNSDAVEATLRKHFGMPSMEAALGVWWLSPTHSVTMNPNSRAFSFILRSLENKLQAVVMGDKAPAEAAAAAEPAGSGAGATPAPAAPVGTDPVGTKQSGAK